MSGPPLSHGQRLRKDSIRWLLALGLLAVTFWAYRDTLSFGFVNIDDPQYVTANSRVQAGLSIENLKWALTTGHFSNWHPLVWLSYMLDCHVFGLNPSAFHAVNLVFHLANVTLLFLLLSKVTGNTIAGFVVAGLFALHPLHCESVVWISERKDVLSTFFGLLALGAYVRYSTRRTVWHWLTVTILLALGLMSKPMLVTWPFVFLLFDYWPLKRLTFPVSLRTVRSLVLEKVPWFGMAAAVSVISLLVQNQLSNASLPLGWRLANALTAYVGYLKKTLIPRHLAVFYPHAALGRLEPLELVPDALVLIAVTGIAILTVRTRPYVAVGWFWYLGTLVPVIGAVQIGYQGLADRYTYIPSIGLFVLLVWAAKDLVSSSRRASLVLAWVACLVVLPALAWATTRQNAYWRDSVSLCEHAIKVTRNNFFAHNNVGATLGEKGDLARAEFHFRRALEIKPDYPPALYNWGLLAQRRGDADEAIVYLRRAVEGDWQNANFHCSLAEALFSKGRAEQALLHYAEALRVDPHHRAARFGRASCYLGRDQVDKAAKDYQNVLESNPEDVPALVNLGTALALQKRFQDADRVLERAVRLDPRSVSAHQNRGRLFEDTSQFDRAADSYRAALKLFPESAVLKEALERVEKARP